MLNDAPREDRVTRSLINRQTLAGNRTRIHRGASVDDYAIHRDSPAGLHNHLVADDHVRGVGAHFGAVAEHPTAVGEQFREFAQRVLRVGECVRFEALADEADEHHFRRDHRLLQNDGGEARDGERQVGADAPLEERFERGVEHAGAADDGRDERVPEAVEFARPGIRFDALSLEPHGDDGPQVRAEQPADDGREQVQAERRLRVKRVVNGADFAVHAAMVWPTPL